MTNRAAADAHRRTDRDRAEATARDGGEAVDHPGALTRPRDRKGDTRAMGQPIPPKVLLLTLSQRTSGRGNAYLSGWLGKARLVGFRGEDDERGNPTWNVYAAEPEPREGGAGDRRGLRQSRESP